MVTITSGELWLLSTRPESVQTTDPLSEKIRSMFEQEDWNEVIESDAVAKFFNHVQEQKLSNDDAEEMLASTVKQIIEENDENCRQLVLLGIVALKLFLQANWTGPPVKVDLIGCGLAQLMQDEHLNIGALAYLSVSGEEVYSLTKFPILLVIASCICVRSRSMLLPYFPTLPLWSLRCITAHSAIMETGADALLARFNQVRECVTQSGLLDSLPKDVVLEYHLECSHLHLDFYAYDDSRACLDRSTEIADMKISLTSALGKRTKFQLTDLAQLKLDVQVNQEREGIRTEAEVTKDLPTDLILDQDTLLPNIRFVDPTTDTVLSSVDQAIIVSHISHIQRTSPKDSHTPDEVMSYLNYVLRSPQSWAVQYKALFNRCMVEKDKMRKMERSITQFEELVKLIEKEAPKASQRLLHVQSSNLQTTWETKRRWGYYLFAFGATDSALEIFLAQHLWEDVISCYQRLGRHEKAENVIREQLEKGETPALYCHLGNATMDKQYYEKAWELSKHKSARSQRLLGLYYLRKSEFELCVPAFQNSLDLNFLQPDIWFSCGCAAMKIDRSELAIVCFQNSVNINSENCHGWANLAATFMGTKQLTKAHTAMKHATQLGYEDWKIWENFLLLCVDMKAFDDAIKCVERLVELNRKKIDVEALTRLAAAVLQDCPDHKNIKAGRFFPRLLQLFAKITNSITDSVVVWDLYATLHLSLETIEHNEKAMLHLYKSHRCYLQNTEWEKKTESLPHVMHISNKLFKVTKEVCSELENESTAVQHLASTRMSLSNLIIRLQKSFVDETGAMLDVVKSHISDLENHVIELEQMLEARGKPE